MTASTIRFFRLAAILATGFVTVACGRPKGQTIDPGSAFPPKPVTKGYVCYRSSVPVIPDGILDEKSWSDAPWTEYFRDIEGESKPEPRFRTRAKMLWDDQNLYIAAELEEPHVWARLKQRDTIIFYDNDFEVFIDPDGDTHNYYELEINALTTAWDLLLIKPYRDGGPPVYGWDIAGLRVGTHINGTLNDPADTDEGWTVEIVLPLESLKECAKGARVPVAGDQWRINFSRVEWRTLVEGGSYRKEVNPATGKPWPEDNWVWSPQGLINMHMPEMWGYLQFSGKVAGSSAEDFRPDPDFDRKWALLQVYYAQFSHIRDHGSYASTLEELGFKAEYFTRDTGRPNLRSTGTTFEAYFADAEGKPGWTIYHDRKLVNQKEIVLEKY